MIYEASEKVKQTRLDRKLIEELERIGRYDDGAFVPIEKE